MSNESNSQDIKPVFMSIEQAEAIIYGQEFFNVRRTYSCAKRNGDIAVKEAERNLHLSTKIHVDLKESLESESREYEKEVESLFLGKNRINEENRGIFLSKSFYSRPSSPSTLRKMSSMDDLRSLPASPVFGRRSMSLTPEPTAYVMDEDHYNTIQAYNGISKNIRNPFSYIPLKSNPLYRSTNICLTNSIQSGNKATSNFLHPFSEPRKHSIRQNADQSRQHNGSVHQPNGKGSIFGSNTPSYYTSTVDPLKKGRVINGHINNSRRLAKQMTLPESWKLDGRIEEEGVESTSPTLTINNSSQNNISILENDKPLHYYIIGRTKYT